MGFASLMFCHEMGHFLAARPRCLPVGTPTFIPSVGAWIQLAQMPHDVVTEADVGLADPVVGSGAALACYFAADAIGNDLLIALASSGLVINLLNLIPVSPVHGGRITAILPPRIGLLVAVMATLQILKVSRGQVTEGLATGCSKVSATRKAG